MSPEVAAKPDPSRCKILESRSQYRACHVRVPDVNDRLAAIMIANRYYSFFKLIKDSQKTLHTATKLVDRGDEVAITRTIKGDVIWIYEPEAQEERANKPQSNLPRIVVSEQWKLLESEREYQSCYIRVPDVAKPMMAIYSDRQYYSYMKTVRDQNQAIDAAERLAKKGHTSRITKTRQAWSIWLLESEGSIHS